MALRIGDGGTAATISGLPAFTTGPVADVNIDAGTIGPLEVRLASVRGAAHRYEGSPRQDDARVACTTEGHGLVALAVADGVSAGAESHRAAALATRRILEVIGDMLAEDPDPTRLAWDRAVGTVAATIVHAARHLSTNPELEVRECARLMATTLSVALVPLDADADGARWCTVVTVGDSGVWLLRRGRSWEPVRGLKTGLDGVLALPLLPAEPVSASFVDLRAGDALFVMSDGVGDPLGDGTGLVAQVLAGQWSRPPNRYEFAAQVDFARRSHTDDRTVVGVWVPPGGGSPW